MFQEFVFVEDFDRSVRPADNVEVDVDHLDPVIVDPLGRGGDVDVDRILGVLAVIDQRPESRWRDQLDERALHRDRRFSTALDLRPDGSAQPQAVLILAKADQFVPPVRLVRVFVELDGDQGPSELVGDYRSDMEGMTRYLATELAQVADPQRAADMAAYMKTDMPFYGVARPEMMKIYREMRRRFPVASRGEYLSAVRVMWAQPHREEKYCAIRMAVDHPAYVTIGSVPLYRRMIVEGAWWDFVDEIAARLIGKVLLDDRERMQPKLDQWIDDPNMWIRRTAILAQLGHKDHTDRDRLFAYCLKRADEKEFFIRKAIGWALREYAKTEPDVVRAFALENRERLSGLSFREATKHLL